MHIGSFKVLLIFMYNEEVSIFFEEDTRRNILSVLDREIELSAHGSIYESGISKEELNRFFRSGYSLGKLNFLVHSQKPVMLQVIPKGKYKNSSVLITGTTIRKAIEAYAKENKNSIIYATPEVKNTKMLVGCKIGINKNLVFNQENIYNDIYLKDFL